MAHGFAGTPISLRPWAEYLAADHSVVLPLLPGHGTRWEDLKTTRWSDWYGAVEAAFTKLRDRCDEMFVCGFSMGGALALHLAARHLGAVSGPASAGSTASCSIGCPSWGSVIAVALASRSSACERARLSPIRSAISIASIAAAWAAAGSPAQKVRVACTARVIARAGCAVRGTGYGVRGTGYGVRGTGYGVRGTAARVLRVASIPSSSEPRVRRCEPRAAVMRSASVEPRRHASANAARKLGISASNRWCFLGRSAHRRTSACSAKRTKYAR
ncbi:alpha/beta hydrolase [Embleya hyalina]|uniref:alpha/beta hydrolase n=1 Tax=Embleya hyalina TaxID=516124 RepID=UPI00159EB1FB